MPQIIEGMRHLKIGKMTELKGRIQPNMVSVRRYFPTIARSGVIGTGVGALPGVGEDVAGWVSYDVGRSVSKEGGKFGKGSLEGLLSSGGANNACIGGALFPLLVLGIPGTPSAAALMGAFKINNIKNYFLTQHSRTTLAANTYLHSHYTNKNTPHLYR